MEEEVWFSVDSFLFKQICAYMGQKKKLGSIIDAVKSILGEDVKVKKLKKVRALESFIEKLEEKEAALKSTLHNGDNASQKNAEKQLAILKKQIKKAQKILEEQKEKN